VVSSLDGRRPNHRVFKNVSSTDGSQVAYGGNAIPTKYESAAKLVRLLAWVQIAVPLSLVIMTIHEGSLIFLLFGGIIFVAPPVALGIVGLGIAKGLRAGTRAVAAVIWSLVHLAAYVALGLHSRTWDASDPAQGRLIFFLRITFWLAVVGHIAVPVVLRPRRAKAKAAAEQGPPFPEIKPPLWPWLVGAAVVLALIALGIPQAGTG
jgi:hypothetical protein